MISLLTVIILSLAQAAVPQQKISCTMDLMPAERHVPPTGLAPIKVQLAANETQQRWNFFIQQATLTSNYGSFYSPYFLSPQVLPPFAEKIIANSQALPKSQIEIILQRFDNDSIRKAGMAIDINIQSGFNASILLEPKIDGPIKVFHSPFTIDNKKIILSVHCEIND
jgi:hypothetical protein